MSLLHSFRDILTVRELDRCRPVSLLEAELVANIKDRKQTRGTYSAVQLRSK